MLTVPLTSIGAILSLWIAPGPLGQGVLLICQLGVWLFPIAWLIGIEHQWPKISGPRRSDWLTGIVLGLLMAGTIWTIYGLFLRDWIDVDGLRSQLEILGKITPEGFLLGCAYFAFVNALIEEYFWRWFIYSRCEEVVSSRIAIILSALFFTTHHTISLARFTDWPVVFVGSLAVFIAGVIWSAYYRRDRSLWSNYFSHAIADLAIHAIAWELLIA